MKGRNEFTVEEIGKLKDLIAKKVMSSSSEQKGIRSKIRKLGFYWSDFSKDEYNVENFLKLITNEDIKVIKK